MNLVCPPDNASTDFLRSEGTNGATVESMKGVNSLIRRFLSVVEVPVFGAAVLAILILGEMNFFTKQVRYETEPIASIGMFFHHTFFGSANQTQVNGLPWSVLVWLHSDLCTFSSLPTSPN